MDDGILTIQLCRTKLQILSQVFIQITTFQALPSNVSSFLDNSSCNSENMVSSSFSKFQLQSYSCRILSSTFDNGSGMFCKAIAPAHPPGGCTPVLAITGYRKIPASQPLHTWTTRSNKLLFTKRLCRRHYCHRQRICNSSTILAQTAHQRSVG